MKKYKKFCFLGIGLLPLVLASCGTNTATKDSQDATEKKVEQVATLTAGTPVQKFRPSNCCRSNEYNFISQCDGGVVSIR